MNIVNHKMLFLDKMQYASSMIYAVRDFAMFIESHYLALVNLICFAHIFLYKKKKTMSQHINNIHAAHTN